MASGLFYVRRFRDQGRKQGQDKPGDHFAIVTDRWVIDSDTFSTELKDKKSICISMIGGSLGARDEANLLCNNLNAAWEAFYSGRKIEPPLGKGETIKRQFEGLNPQEMINILCDYLPLPNESRKKLAVEILARVTVEEGKESFKDDLIFDNPALLAENVAADILEGDVVEFDTQIVARCLDLLGIDKEGNKTDQEQEFPAPEELEDREFRHSE